MRQPTKSQALRRLNNVLSPIQSLIDGQRLSADFEIWQRNSETAIANAFGENSRHFSNFTSISYTPAMVFAGMDRGYYDRSYLSGLNTARSMLTAMIAEVEEYWDDDPDITPQIDTDGESDPISNKVMIVHGHDESARLVTERFLERLGMEFVVLHDMPNLGRTIIEKFEDHSDVGFAIVLLTPDDIGASRRESDNLTARARQNVIFELGYLAGKIGRSRVCALIKDKVEMPSDYSGVVYVPMDENGGWQMKIVSELQSLGIVVDANRLTRSS